MKLSVINDIETIWREAVHPTGGRSHFASLGIHRQYFLLSIQFHYFRFNVFAQSGSNFGERLFTAAAASAASAASASAATHRHGMEKSRALAINFRGSDVTAARKYADADARASGR